MALSNIFSMTQMQTQQFHASLMAGSMMGTCAPQGGGMGMLGGMFQGLLGSSMGLPFMMGGQMGMMGILMAQYSMQAQQAQMMQQHMQMAQRQAATSASRGPATEQQAERAVRSGASPADGLVRDMGVQRQVGQGSDGQIYSSAATYGKREKAVDDATAAARYPTLARLDRFAQQAGSLDGSFITSASSAQQDEASYGRLQGVIGVAEDDMKALEEKATPAERLVLAAEEKKLQSAQAKARAQGVPMSAEALAKQRVMYRERLAAEGKIGKGMATQNQALLELYRTKDRADANMHLKWGRERNLDAGNFAIAGSPFNPNRTDAYNARSDWYPSTAEPGARMIRDSVYRDYSIGGLLSGNRADKLGLDRLPVWN